ncbi:DUF1007 family protein [Pararhizobium sp. IMCC21322]|uniref:DUF1007 family protein n=1 Tax=Pararhizobium sp. IMCC21322 TaxID=3067903 RepID=UPI002741AEF3|nr:DUF1007 family protein [Pararhizobium sp. IMCC21322]
MTRSGMSSLVFSAAFLTGLSSMPEADAHPHVWVDTRAEVVFDAQDRVSAVRHAWTFDDAFSVYVIQGLDENEDGIYTREELSSLAQVNVESLADYEFFTFMGVEEAEVDFDGPVDYWLYYDADKSRLTLNFTLPLKQPALVIGDLILEIYDPEAFVAFSVNEEDSIKLASGAPNNCSVEVKPAEEMDDAFAAALAELPADQRQVPDEFFSVTSKLSNSAVIRCR